MKTSRQRLLTYLKKKQVASAHEISLALKMTSANARHHLSILVDQGSVEVIGKRVGLGRGRPHNLYRVTKSGFKSNLPHLTNLLFRELFEGEKTNQDCEKKLKKIASRFNEGDIPGSPNPTHKLNEMVNQLNKMNYEARWEAHIDAPHIILNNCPYLSIVDDIPEICRMDKYFLEQKLVTPVSQAAKLEKSPFGLPRCIFIVGK